VCRSCLMGSQRQLSKLSSREAILLSGAKCFMERGYSATSIDEIAERINATKGMVYHYYGSKAELYFEVHQRGMDALFEAVEPLAKAEQSGKDRFYAMALAHVSTLLETQPFQRAMSEGVTMHLRHGGSEAQRQQLKMLQTRRNAYETMFLQVLNEGIEDGTLISQVPRVA